MNAMDTLVPSPEGFDPAPTFNPLLWLIGVDRETLCHCPQSEIDTLSLFGMLLAFGWAYLAGVLMLVGHRLFAVPGQFRIDLVMGGLFLASFLSVIDVTMVIRSSFYRSGEHELKRAGLDITGGPWVTVKVGFFLVFRILLSVSIAALTGTFVSLIVFSTDIDARVHDIWGKANAPLIASASASVDAERTRAIDVLKDEEQRFNALSKQALAMRQNQLDPLANDPLVQQAQAELTRLAEQKAKDDEEVRRAEKFESDEKGGIQGSAKNSGHAGNGPRHRAAVEQLIYARAHARATAKDLADAQSRLDALRTRLAGTADTARQKSVDETPEFEKALAAEGKEHDRLKREVALLGNDRDGAIRKLVEQAPGYVPPDNGLLMQIRLLGDITEGDRKLKAIVILIEIASFGFELAAVLAKTMSYAPTSYTARLARDVYLRVVDLVDETAARLNSKGKSDDDDPLSPVPGGAAQRPPKWSVGGMPSADGTATFDVFGDIGDPKAASEKPKRKRGRPRKDPLH